jgi:pyridoxal phosphate enzyme (YggS family)
MPTPISDRLQQVLERIHAAELSAGRSEGGVTLLAVSKTQPASVIREAATAGQTAFGENYLQEALAKQDALADLPELVWHFIGPIQSNKTRPIAERFEWVHTVDRLRIAERLSQQRPADKPPLNVCLQINVSGEATKSGVTLAALPELAAAVAQLPRLRLRGLMAIPAPATGLDRQRIPFRILREAMAALALPGLDTLSMGMSDDLEAAILEGATLVRVGTAIFGPRPG